MEYQKMKFKFKVGDRVRYVEAGRAGVNNGDIVTVTECDGSLIPYKVENENKHWTWAYADDVEAMEAQPAGEDEAPAKPPRRLKYGRRRMAFEFTKALLSNPALERSYLDTPEALASVADTIALELIKRWKEVE
jgi:hypothetical protein